MSDFKIHLQSALQTFVAGFLATLGAQLSNGMTIEWTSTFWIALILAAVRSGVKVAFEQFAPEILGGKK